MRITALVTLASALALGACDRSEPDALPIENEVIDNNIEVIEEPVPVPVNIVEEEPEKPNTTAPAAPPPKVSEEEQMFDDADATGLTARLPQVNEQLPGSDENGTRPAD